jgi:hypothetical protein
MNYNCRVIILPDCNMFLKRNPLFPVCSSSEWTSARKKAFSTYMKETYLQYE